MPNSIKLIRLFLIVFMTMSLVSMSFGHLLFWLVITVLLNRRSIYAWHLMFAHVVLSVLSLFLDLLTTDNEIMSKLVSNELALSSIPVSFYQIQDMGVLFTIFLTTFFGPVVGSSLYFPILVGIKLILLCLLLLAATREFFQFKIKSTLAHITALIASIIILSGISYYQRMNILALMQRMEEQNTQKDNKPILPSANAPANL